MHGGRLVGNLGHRVSHLYGRKQALDGKDSGSVYDRSLDRIGRHAEHGSRLVRANSRDEAHRDHKADDQLADRDQLDGEGRHGLPGSLCRHRLGHVRRVDGHHSSLEVVDEVDRVDVRGNPDIVDHRDSGVYDRPLDRKRPRDIGDRVVAAHTDVSHSRELGDHMGHGVDRLDVQGNPDIVDRRDSMVYDRPLDRKRPRDVVGRVESAHPDGNNSRGIGDRNDHYAGSQVVVARGALECPV